jgi:hypothetical protein
MNPDDQDFQQFLPNGGKSANSGPTFTEIPTFQPLKVSKLPSGLNYIACLYLEGEAYRSLNKGAYPAWVLVSGWIAYALYALCALHALQALVFERPLSPFSILPSLFFVLGLLLFLVVLIRGTQAYCKRQTIKAQRSAHYARAMRDNGRT